MARTVTRTVLLANPAGSPSGQDLGIAPRLPSLRGKVVGLVDNTKTNADRYLAALGELLISRYGVASVLPLSKATHIRAPFLDRLAQECQAVVNAFGA